MTHFHFGKCLGYIGSRFHLSLTLLDFRKIKRDDHHLDFEIFSLEVLIYKVLKKGLGIL